MKLIAVLLALALSALAVNWDFPEDLALDCKVKLAYFLDAYETACQDSINIGGVMFAIPASAQTYWRSEAQSARADFVAAWQALNDYILEN